VILEDGVIPNEHSSRNQEFQSQIPKHIAFDGTPNMVCWQDIELFYLPNNDGPHMPCAIIDFRNVKGRPEGADG
jgi:hypothetical protein